MGKVNRRYKRAKVVKPVALDSHGFASLQYNVPKGVKDDKKIKPKDVFEGFKEKKNTKNRKGKG